MCTIGKREQDKKKKRNTQENRELTSVRNIDY